MSKVFKYITGGKKRKTDNASSSSSLPRPDPQPARRSVSIHSRTQQPQQDQPRRRSTSSRQPTINPNPQPSQTPPPPPPDPSALILESNIYIQRKADLEPRKLIITKFAHVPTLSDLALEQGVRFLLRRGGLEGMLERNADTFEKITREFLYTMDSTITSTGEQAISFRMFNQPQQMMIVLSPNSSKR